jgi:glycosyltransferase involved in cell wall biosynthesis
MVSVLLCTSNRRHLIGMALDSYRLQTYEPKQLVVVDDGDDSIYDLVADIDNCNYMFYPATSLSQKRNVGIREAKGELICHFDSDDWSAPKRLWNQVETLLQHNAEMVGYHTAYFWDEIERRASCYRNGTPNYSWGPCLMYRKQFAIEHPWPEDAMTNEDENFVAVAQKQKVIVATDGRGQIVVRLHSQNARHDYIGGFVWPIVPTSDLPEGFRKAARIQ